MAIPKIYYRYEPSLPAAITFSCIFGITAFFHLYQLIRTRCWFWIPFMIGGFFETIGFAFRAVNASEQQLHWSFPPFVIQTLGLLLAPVLFAASMYATLGRISELAKGEKKLLVRRSWLTKFFVGGDIFAFLVQCLGAIEITQVNNSKALQRGRTIILIGLCLQIASFGLFIATTSLFWFRMQKEANATKLPQAPWRKHIATLLTGSTLILARCIYRVVEYEEGALGYLIVHEVFVYTLDAGLMLFVMLNFHFVHPSEIKAILHGGNKAVLFKISRVPRPGSIQSDQEFPMTAGHHFQ